jgi:hypothetical protein
MLKQVTRPLQGLHVLHGVLALGSTDDDNTIGAFGVHPMDEYETTE